MRTNQISDIQGRNSIVKIVKATVITLATLVAIAVIAELVSTASPANREYHRFGEEEDLEQKISEARNKIFERRYVEALA